MSNVVKKLKSLIVVGILLTSNSGFIQATQSVAKSSKVVDIEDGTILHAWNWSLDTIKARLPEIKEAGYVAVQTSPLQGTKETSKQGSKWWLVYQPINFNIGNTQLGSKEDLKELCEEADKYGIKIIVDVIFNHTANQTGDDISYKVDPVLRDNSSFWHYPLRSITNYNDRWQLTQQDVGGLPDLNTSNKALQRIIINYLEDLIACGVDGFRVDTAKHIELPTDPVGSDFWPTITELVNNKNVFMYGEVLQGCEDKFYEYSKYIDVTASNYGHALRRAVGFGNSPSINGILDYQSAGVAPDHLVTFLETHDTYANDNQESTYLNDWQIKMGWAILAARKDTVPLYFNRPTTNARTNKFANELGTAGNNEWKSQDVVSVNKFHTAMAGEGEYIRKINDNALMIERGNKGVVIVNLGGEIKNCYIDTALEAGRYKNSASAGGEFEAKAGKLIGTIPAGSIVVLQSQVPSVDGKLSISIEGGEEVFYGETKELTLNATHYNKAYYRIDDGEWLAFENGKKISIGGNKAYNSITKVEVKAEGAGQWLQTSKQYIKVQQGKEKAVYFKNSYHWSDVYVYIYDDSVEPLRCVKQWPGILMKQVDSETYKGIIPADYENPKVIFSNGRGEQVPAANEPGYSVKAPMIYKEGKMYYHLVGDSEEDRPIEKQGVIQIKRPIGWTNDLYCYIYNEQDGKVKEIASWPGVKMVTQDNELYSFNMPEGWNKAKIIFSDGHNQTPGSGQEGFNYSGKNMIFIDGKWIQQ